MSSEELLNDKAALAEQLREIRIKAEMTQDEVAQRSTLARNQVIAIEKGTGNPTMDTLIKYLDAIGGRLQVESQW